MSESEVTVTKGNTKRRRLRWQGAFLGALRNSCNVRAACEKAKISRKTAYEHRNNDPEFAALWAEAEQDAIDILEAEAWHRGRAQSDGLLMFLLKAHRPAKYREAVRLDLNLLRQEADELLRQLGLPDLDTDEVVTEAVGILKSGR